MYSKDLRWRVISLKYQCRFSNRRIARLLDMHKSTVKRILRKFLLTGDVQCFKVGRPNISSLHVHEQFVLVEAAVKDPSMTLEGKFNIRLARSTVYPPSKEIFGGLASHLSRSV